MQPDTLVGVVSVGHTVALTLDRSLAWLLAILAVGGFVSYVNALRDISREVEAKLRGRP
jgi:hypothetical protein